MKVVTLVDRREQGARHAADIEDLLDDQRPAEHVAEGDAGRLSRPAAGRCDARRSGYSHDESRWLGRCACSPGSGPPAGSTASCRQGQQIEHAAGKSTAVAMDEQMRPRPAEGGKPPGGSQSRSTANAEDQRPGRAKPGMETPSTASKRADDRSRLSTVEGRRGAQEHRDDEAPGQRR